MKSKSATAGTKYTKSRITVENFLMITLILFYFFFLMKVLNLLPLHRIIVAMALITVPVC